MRKGGASGANNERFALDVCACCSESTPSVQIFDNAVDELGEDAQLPAVQNVKRFLLKGIGVHHGGLIPLVKELVEILFQVRLAPHRHLHPVMWETCHNVSFQYAKRSQDV